MASETDKQPDRQAGRQGSMQASRQQAEADKQPARQAGKQACRPTCRRQRQKGRQTDRQRYRQTRRQTNRQAGNQACRQADRQAETDKQPDRQAGKEACRLGARSVGSLLVPKVCLWLASGDFPLGCLLARLWLASGLPLASQPPGSSLQPSYGLPLACLWRPDRSGASLAMTWETQGPHPRATERSCRLLMRILG